MDGWMDGWILQKYSIAGEGKIRHTDLFLYAYAMF